MLRLSTVLLLPDEDQEARSLALASAYPPEDRLDEGDMAAARWCWDHSHPTGRGSDTLPAAMAVPAAADGQRHGRGGIVRDLPGPLLTPDERRLLDALVDQVAVRDRAGLPGARVGGEPSAGRNRAIAGRAADLNLARFANPARLDHRHGFEPAQFADKYDATDRDELLATLESEAERLNRFVGTCSI